MINMFAGLTGALQKERAHLQALGTPVWLNSDYACELEKFNPRCPSCDCDQRFENCFCDERLNGEQTR